MMAEGFALVLHFELWTWEVTFTEIHSRVLDKKGTKKRKKDTTEI